MPDKKASRKKANVFQRFGRSIQQFFRETIGELRKVSWPTRQEAINLTRIVLLVIFAMAFFLGILDFIYTWIFSLII